MALLRVQGYTLKHRKKFVLPSHDNFFFFKQDSAETKLLFVLA